MDDIVTILRKEYDHFNDDGVGDYEVIITAADEIECLRKELRMAKKWRDNYKLAWERATGQTTPRGYKETMWNENGTFP